MVDECLKEKIRHRAYEIWQARIETGQHIIIDKLGNEKEITPEDDWIQAANEVIQEEEKKWGLK